jgi:hypothetical protein
MEGLKKIDGRSYPKRFKGNFGYRLRYVRYPVQVTKEGFSYLLSPAMFDTFEDCKTQCDNSNELFGFSLEFSNQIISKSMNLN